MFTIYSDKLIFEDIISSGKFPNWEKIITNHSQINLDINSTDLNSELGDPNSIIFQFLLSSGKQIDICDADIFFKKIKADNMAVIDKPTAAYFLNIPEADAKKLQEESGVVVNCKDFVDDNILSKGVNLDWLADEVINNNWNSILNPFNNFPSNSLIINDRNLFSNEERVLGTFQNIGVDNLIRILDNLLPQNLKTDYHILIQSEQKDDPRNKAKCDQITSDLNTKIRNLRNYNFEIEILFYCRGTNHFERTHNRRIYSNYKYGKCENSLASFKIRNANNTRNDDSFSLVCFFNKLNSIPDTNTNLMSHNNGSSRCREIAVDCIDKLNKNGPNNRYYRYYLNGTEVIQGQTTAIKNRLLN